MRCEGNDTEIGIEPPFEDIVVPAAPAAASIVPLLGYGRAHLLLGFAATVTLARRSGPSRAFTAGRSSATSSRSTVDYEVVESLKPEVLGSMGYAACKPEPDEPTTTGALVKAT
jgi:hypothetical protein